MTKRGQGGERRCRRAMSFAVQGHRHATRSRLICPRHGPSPPAIAMKQFVTNSRFHPLLKRATGASISQSARHWLGCMAAFHAPRYPQPDSLIGDPLIAQEMEMQIRPLYDRVIVKRIETQRTTASGIVIPDSAAEKPEQGEIVAVGNGRLLQGRHAARAPVESRRPGALRQIRGPDRQGGRRGTAGHARRGRHGRTRTRLASRPTSGLTPASTAPHRCWPGVRGIPINDFFRSNQNGCKRREIQRRRA